MDIVDELIALCEIHGRTRYGGEPISQMEHALQGGRYSSAEANRFSRSSFAEDVERLHHWGDRAKAPGAATRAIRDYATLLRDLGT